MTKDQPVTRIGTISAPPPPSAAAICPEIAAAAAFTGSADKWAYRAVVAACVCPKEFTDHQQAIATRSADTGEGMAQVMQPHVRQPSRRTDGAPWLLQVHQPSAILLPDDNVRVAFHPRQARQHRQGRWRELHCLRAGLKVRQPGIAP